MLILKIFAGVIAVILAGLTAAAWWVSRPIFDEIRDPARLSSIANPREALTFARSAEALIRVTGQTQTEVSGVDLTAALGVERTADLIALYAELGYERLAAVDGPPIAAPLATLGPPVDYVAPFIGAGTNYAEHAEEVLLDDPPFLFPKLAGPSGWNAPVSFVPRLDYEAELAMTPLSDIDTPNAEVEYGLVLCNDFTDRWTLIRELRLSKPMGTTGFASAKGRESFLPTGALFVIPRSKDFYRRIEHRLYVNDQLRQRFVAGDMILKVEDIVTQAFVHRDRTFWRSDKTVPLMPEGRIPRGTLILTGTAGGVVFKPANIWAPWPYLQRGDTVRTEADGLGHLVNTIQ